MKKTMKQLFLSVLMLLAVGTVGAQEYDFTTLGNKVNPTKGDAVTVGGLSMWKITCGEETFDGRFAYGARTSGADDSGNYRFLNEESDKGFDIIWGDRTFAVLGLKNGDKVTFNVYKNSLSFIGKPALNGVASGATVVSGTTYTVSTTAETVDLLLKSDAAHTEIQSVTIVEYVPVVSETVTVGVVGYENTIDFTDESTANPTVIDPLTSSDGTEFDRLAFASGVKLTDVTFTENYGLKILWAHKLLTVKDLKVGETFTVNFTTTELNISGTSMLEGVADNGALTSGTEYTVKTAGDLVLDNQGKNTTISSIVIAKAAQNIGGATLVSENALDFTGVEDIQAYVAVTANAGTVSFKQVKKVPAGTPVYLKASKAVSVNVPILDGAAEAIEDNLLKGSATNTTALQSDDNTKYYVFGVKDAVAGFYPVGTTKLTSASGKAYLQLTAEQAAAARRLNLVFDANETTAIQSQKTQTNAAIIYNLRGQRVAVPTKGLYIKNGKKYMVK